MAAKKQVKKPKRTAAPRRSRAKAAPALSPEAKREISAVLLGVFALLTLFGCFNFGGTLVTGMFHGLRVAMGYSAYLLPIICGALAWMLFQPSKYPVNGLNYIGFIGLLASLSSLFHVGISPADAQLAAENGFGGGYLGYGITSAALNVLNGVALSIVLVALMAVFLIFATNTNLKALFGAILSGFTREGKEGEEKESDQKPAIAELTVNDNSGAPANTALPMRGELNLGSARRPAPAPAEPQEALTANSEEAWTPPGLELLESTSTKADAGDVKANAATIQQTLESFGINVQMAEVNVGPTVTQYTFTPPAGVKLNKITGLDTNLALSLAAHPIRIEAPIPGKSAVGVEIPNKSIATVRLRDVLSAPEVKSQTAPLTFVLGRDVTGTPMTTDLAKMPHLLIAGATGSGKSVMINTLLTSLLYRNSPADMKLILVDPKRVELGLYNDIPHLLTPVIVEPEKCISALKWAVAEMERRYKLLAEMGNRNIVEYNNAHKEEAMPYIVIVIDELADLMVLAAQDVEGLIVRLAQMARAVGIHLVLATQRPSVDVIT
ncbi:MAG TPA: DNA translocase FtsK 4TM domain-containing protein, partial [Candidatus Saccharimonadia bacterium]|nr:DNA translocase FtsK 4TM domain-containing protein [Candidatus Saccharimonadia bacterium]